MKETECSNMSRFRNKPVVVQSLDSEIVCEVKQLYILPEWAGQYTASCLFVFCYG